jgi:hypothetical protein
VVRAASMWPQCDTAGCQFSYIVPTSIVWISPPLVPGGAQLLFQTCMCNSSTYSLHARRILFCNSSLFTVEFFGVLGMRSKLSSVFILVFHCTAHIPPIPCISTLRKSSLVLYSCVSAPTCDGVYSSLPLITPSPALRSFPGNTATFKFCTCK